ncbi:xanthine dehydrogenase accessory factor [Halarchaeum solikamskense]|uniref:XdhC family protein n=1 Tax=Halarchaeum nitratireducens TaxID=489913 RepID=UPI001B3AE192|nr:XdhC/CoxI family protein [Halarchaeum solikamskense]MBP2252487.1 xanthine dehydrogenase accessory factor [Halarchaeum solikamskense]
MTGPATDPWSATQRTIRTSMREHVDAAADAAVATVVHVEGSGYRRPGARMVVDPDGDSHGAVTAGCLEDSVVDAARRTIDDGRSRLHTYDLRDDDADIWGLGLGCNGVVDVLVEPLDTSFTPVLDALDANRPVTVFTVVASSDPALAVGDRHIVGHDTVSTARDPLPDTVVEPVASRLDDATEDVAVTTDVETAAGTARVFANRLLPAPELLVFGGQPDVNPVASLAARAGFRVRVATARGAQADADRFPSADDVVSTRPADLDAVVDVPEHTYAVLMSHNALDDRLALDALLDTDVPYVGVLGPRSRFRELREAMDRSLTVADEARIAAPCGLDLGGDEPTAIGFSIVSELLAVHNDRSGGRLVERPGPIHERPEIT